MHYTRDNLPGFANVYSDEELAATPWYYSVELEPGHYTPGQGFWNVALTRALIASMNVNGQACLDIGTMEGLVPTVLCRAGADRVVAYDRAAAMARRIELIRKTYNVDFELLNGFPLENLRARLGARAPFDVVVNSGVLYHLFSPLTGLAIARGLVRNGGIMIVETAAVVADNPAMHWNERDRFTGQAYFLPSIRCLDYMLRFLRLSIVDAVHVPTHVVDGLLCCRVAVACRAETRPVGDPSDGFLQGTIHTENDMSENIDWANLTTLLPPVPFTPAEILAKPTIPVRMARRAMRLLNPDQARRLDARASWKERAFWQRSNVESLDLFRVVDGSRALVIDPEQTRLSLAA